MLNLSGRCQTYLTRKHNPAEGFNSMKRQRSDKGGIRWDESNLAENEQIKAELAPRKIDEPKTPYHGRIDLAEEGGEACIPQKVARCHAGLLVLLQIQTGTP